MSRRPSSFDDTQDIAPKRFRTHPLRFEDVENTEDHLARHVLSQPPEGHLENSFLYLKSPQNLALTWIGVVSGGTHGEAPTTKEFGPYIISSFLLITDPAYIAVPTYEVEYYNTDEDGAYRWSKAIVEARAVLKLAPLLRGQNIEEDIRHNPEYSGHVHACEKCNTWHEKHGAGQCIPDDPDEDEGERYTVILGDDE